MPKAHPKPLTVTSLLIGLLAVLALADDLKAQTQNGFNLTDALVPADEILSGGPPRDGIPALTDPAFLPAAQADFLAPDDRVLGLSVGGETRAYPIAILDWHELVNDRIGGRDVLVTWCPLCGSGVAYDARVNGQRLDFGVSGLLYNSDVLFYDRHSESLWSQLRHQAISGAFKGRRLDLIPVTHTTWSDWLARHPDTAVLSTQTGHRRDYTRSPYAGYAQSPQIMFPVAFRAQGYHPKEQVLGLELNGKAKAYPFAELAAHGTAPLRDSVGGQAVTVRFDPENRHAAAFDASDEALPGVVAFWFAWFAFHPETQVFKAATEDTP